MCVCVCVCVCVCARLALVELVKLGAHNGRSEYVFTRSGQNPVLVNIAELLLPGFPINRDQFVATSA